MSDPLTRQTGTDLKACCADLYSSDLARWLLGDSFHPGGLVLTTRLGELLQIGPNDRVLDVACGHGGSAIALAEHLGCQVTGVDYGAANVERAFAAARQSTAASRLSFTSGDAENLQFDDGSFDVVICECSFCTFPKKSRAASEFHRVLAPGGRVGLSDLTRSGTLPPELDGLIGQIICIADACPTETYLQYLTDEGFLEHEIERHDDALRDLISDIRTRLMGAQLFAHTQGLDLPDIDLDQAQGMARSAAAAVENGTLGYVVITARRSIE